jgi:hypothetical protein
MAYILTLITFVAWAQTDSLVQNSRDLHHITCTFDDPDIFLGVKQGRCVNESRFYLKVMLLMSLGVFTRTPVRQMHVGNVEEERACTR